MTRCSFFHSLCERGTISSRRVTPDPDTALLMREIGRNRYSVAIGKDSIRSIQDYGAVLEGGVGRYRLAHFLVTVVLFRKDR